MSITEAARARLLIKLREVLGREAETLMEYLAPLTSADISTRDDLEMVHTALRSDIAVVDQRIETSKHEVVAVFRQELNTAITSQTRTMIWTMVATMSGTVLALAALVLGTG